MIQRFINLIKGWFSQFLSSTEQSNPEALLELEVENLRSQVARYNRGLISHAALCERLMSQIKRLDAERESLNIKIPANIKVGNRVAAGQYALRLQHVEQELTENQKQSESAESTYKELVRGRDSAVGIAKAKIESLKNGITDMRMQQAVAEMSEMASGLVSEIGGSGDTLDRLSKMVDNEREKAAGRARVAKDTSDPTITATINATEEERAIAAELALKAFESNARKAKKEKEASA